MSRPGAVAVAATLWCVVVVVAASVVWIVIDRAGQGVVPTSQADAPGTGSAPPQRHPASRVKPSQPTDGPHPTRAGRSPSRTTAPSGTVSSRPSAEPPTVPVRRGSWSGTAGHLAAQCRGQVASLISTYPNPGWGYVIESRGPGIVRVRYQREDRYVTVSARCVSGSPQYAVIASAPGDD
jgi:hypothetical protein